MVVAFTSGTNNFSNAPLQSLYWQVGKPCAFTSEAAVVAPGQIAPMYYPLEAATNVDAC